MSNGLRNALLTRVSRNPRVRVDPTRYYAGVRGTWHLVGGSPCGASARPPAQVTREATS